MINDYIGVDGGYICGFSCSSPAEFYPYYCGLDIKHLELEGMATRERFVFVLEKAATADQAKILRWVVKKCPPSQRSTRRTPARAQEIARLADHLGGIPAVQSPRPQITSDVVERAINDAEALIAENGASSGVDRGCELIVVVLRVGVGAAFFLHHTGGPAHTAQAKNHMGRGVR